MKMTTKIETDLKNKDGLKNINDPKYEDALTT